MTAIRELLTYYKWDEQRLIGEYFEYENDPAAFFQQAKVANPFNIPPPAATNNSTDCEICCSGVSPDVSSDKKIPLFCLLKTKHTFFQRRISTVSNVDISIANHAGNSI